MLIQVIGDQVEVAASEDIERLREAIADDDRFLEVIQEFAGASIYIPKALAHQLQAAEVRGEFRTLKAAGIRTSEAARMIARSRGKSARWVYFALFGRRQRKLRKAG